MWIVCVCVQFVVANTVKWGLRAQKVKMTARINKTKKRRVDLQRLKGHLNTGNISPLPQLPPLRPLQNNFQNYCPGVDSVFDSYT